MKDDLTLGMNNNYVYSLVTGINKNQHFKFINYS